MSTLSSLTALPNLLNTQNKNSSNYKASVKVSLKSKVSFGSYTYGGKKPNTDKE